MKFPLTCPTRSHCLRVNVAIHSESATLRRQIAEGVVGWPCVGGGRLNLGAPAQTLL